MRVQTCIGLGTAHMVMRGPWDDRQYDIDLSDFTIAAIDVLNPMGVQPCVSDASCGAGVCDTETNTCTPVRIRVLSTFVFGTSYVSASSNRCGCVPVSCLFGGFTLRACLCHCTAGHSSQRGSVCVYVGVHSRLLRLCDKHVQR